MQRRTAIGLGVAAAAMAALPVWAQTGFPERPIKILQGFAPGGNADTIARLVGTEMGKSLGQSFVVEAVTGAGGNIAAERVARARPDGYTLLRATGGHAVAGAIYNKLSYRTVEDFEMVSTITYFPFLIVVPADSPFQSLGALLNEARSKPKAIGYGSAGIGTGHHLAGELLAKMARADLLHVPYRGDAASITAVLGGEVPCVIAPPTAVLPQIKAGKLRALAVTGPQRWPVLPDTPTVAEQGVAQYDVRSWAGVMAPAGTPRAIVNQLSEEVRKALQLPAVRARLEEMGGDVRASTPEEMKAMVTSQLQRWVQLVAEANIAKQ